MAKVDFKKKEEGYYTLCCLDMVCPHPQLYTKKAIARIAQGELLEVEFDNPSSGEAIESISTSSGFEITKKDKMKNKDIWILKKTS